MTADTFLFQSTSSFPNPNAQAQVSPPDVWHSVRGVANHDSYAVSKIKVSLKKPFLVSDWSMSHYHGVFSFSALIVCS